MHVCLPPAFFLSPFQQLRISDTLLCSLIYFFEELQFPNFFCTFSKEKSYLFELFVIAKSLLSGFLGNGWTIAKYDPKSNTAIEIRFFGYIHHISTIFRSLVMRAQSLFLQLQFIYIKIN